MFMILMLVLQVVLFVAGALLNKGPKVEGARPKALGEFQFPTADESRAVPIVWGTMDIKGPNVIWYGDLSIKKITQRVKTGMFSKKKVTVGFRYFVGIDLLLCYGVIDRVTKLVISDRTAFTGSLNVAAGGDAGVVLNVNKPNLLGGKEKGGGVVGNFRVYAGTANQAKNSYLINRGPGAGNAANVPAYVDISHVVAEKIEVGESENIGAYVFRVSRFPNNLGLTSGHHIVNGTVDNGDANPAEVLYELLTGKVFGLEFDISVIDLVSFKAVGETLWTENNGMSMCITSELPAEQLVDEILRQIDGLLFEDSDGIFRLKLIRDDYVFANLPIFNESNTVEVEKFTRLSWSETHNHVSAGYTDRTKDFIQTASMAQDLANFRTTNQENRMNQSYLGLAHPTTARVVAERELLQVSFPFATVKLKVNRKGQQLRPGDAIRFSWAKFNGLTDMVLRVLVVELGELFNGVVTLECMQDVFRLSETIFADPQATGWVAPQSDAAAFTTELVRSTPRLYLNLSFLTVGELSPNVGERVHSMAATPNGVVTDFEQWVDTGGGAGYEGQIGGATATTPTGTLLNAYPANTADIETGNTLVVTALDAPEALTDLTGAIQIEDGLNLALIQGATEGEDEIIGWETLVDLGGGNYALHNVHRGLLDTKARAHLSAARVWFFTDGQAISDITYGDTQAINVKHQAQTPSSVLDIALATARALTFQSRLKRPHHPADLTIDTVRWTTATTANAPIDVAWTHRTNDDPKVRDANVASLTAQHTEVEYDLVFIHASTGATIRTEVRNSALGAGWLAYSYAAATAQADTGEAGDFPLRVTMRARYAAGATVNPANLASLQTIDCSVIADLGGALVRSIDLDGAEHVANTTNNALSFANVFTFEGWFKPTGTGGALRKLLMFRNTGGEANRIDLDLPADTNGQPFRIRLWNSAGTLFKLYTFGSYTASAWTCLAFTWDGTALKVYQNGADVTAGATKTTDNAGTMTDTGRAIILGVDETLMLNRYVGFIYRLAVWNVVRSAASLTTTYNGGDGDAFSVRHNTGNYAERDNLRHMWDWRIASNIGADFGHITSDKIDIDANALLVDSSDHSTDVP